MVERGGLVCQMASTMWGGMPVWEGERKGERTERAAGGTRGANGHAHGHGVSLVYVWAHKRGVWQGRGRPKGGREEEERRRKKRLLVLVCTICSIPSYYWGDCAKKHAHIKNTSFEFLYLPK